MSKGTYSNMRDHYLRDLAFNPDYQPAQIQPMDDQTLRNAFTLQPGITPEVGFFYFDSLRSKLMTNSLFRWTHS